MNYKQKICHLLKGFELSQEHLMIKQMTIRKRGSRWINKISGFRPLALMPSLSAVAIHALPAPQRRVYTSSDAGGGAAAIFRILRHYIH